MITLVLVASFMGRPNLGQEVDDEGNRITTLKADETCSMIYREEKPTSSLQTPTVGDINQDGYPDLGFSRPGYDLSEDPTEEVGKINIILSDHT